MLQFATAALALASATSPDLQAPSIPSVSIAELLTEPLVKVQENGETWVRNRHTRICFEDGACVVHPVFGPDAAREWPVRFELGSVRRGTTEIDVAPLGSSTVEEGRVVQPRGGLTGVYHLRLDEIEQTFVFDDLPGDGDLVLTIDVETDLSAIEGQEITFQHDHLGGVTYGRAFAVDGAGRRTEIERAFDGSSIRLVVPEAFLATATLPLTVDPPISTFLSGPITGDATSPDITYSGLAERYFVCWEEITSSLNSDVYLTSFSRAGNGGTVRAIEMGSLVWQAPRLAYIPGGNRLLVVAQVRGPVEPTDKTIRGQLADSVTGVTLGSSFLISNSDASPRFDPDVGGTNRTAPTSNHFLVVWSRTGSTGTVNLVGRVIDWTGAPVTGVQTISSAFGVEAVQAAVSESHGDSTLFGDLWTVAWIRDDDGDGRGEVWARRIAWNGNLGLGAGNFVVDTWDDCSHPSVTSRLDEPVFGDRPSIVAYERRNDFAGVLNSNIYAAVVIDGVAYTSSPISTVRQDLLAPLFDQMAPSIATDGSGFLLTYVNDGLTRDTFMLSGHVARTATGAFVALAERGSRVSSPGGQDVQCRVATIQDGDSSSVLDDGACVWLELLPGGTIGFIRGSTLDIATLGTPTDRAVGLQYCDATPNDTGQSSWLAIFGNQSRFTIHEAVCVNVTPNAFGYLLCADLFGNVNMPGGSAGRLCISGNIGRYVTAIQSSGSAGRLETNILPLFLPQPTGPVSAAPGDTWFFQYWHRDVAGGAPTSNFSNACSMYFVP
ncbi:MAG: hypothetical protein AAGI22_13615 [Planctomycetota bacterium]